jgi:hypothetical protein
VEIVRNADTPVGNAGAGVMIVVTVGRLIIRVQADKSVRVPSEPFDPTRRNAAAFAAGVHYSAAKSGVAAGPHFAFDLFVAATAIFYVKLAAIGDALFRSVLGTGHVA